MIESIFLLIALIILVGSVLGFFSFIRSADLRRRMDSLEQDLRNLTANQPVNPNEFQLAPEPPVPETADESEIDEAQPATARQPLNSLVNLYKGSQKKNRLVQLFGQFKIHWMIWLGGFSLSLSGVFLAIYAIEQGLINPTARIILGSFAGLAMHIAAETLRQRSGSIHATFSALAAAGSITLFAMILAALHLYTMLNPTSAFILLSVVAFGTMALALIHGPVLAAMGILGAFLVPALIATENSDVVIALIYSTVISASALLLLRYVYRPWLWWGFLAGAISWWGLTLADANADGLRGWYLAAIAYLMLAVPSLHLRLDFANQLAKENYRLSNWFSLPEGAERNLLAGLLIIILAQSVSIVVEMNFHGIFWHWSLLITLLLITGRYRESLNLTGWITLLATSMAFLVIQLTVEGDRIGFKTLNEPDSTAFLHYLLGSALLISLLSLSNSMTVTRFKASWASLAILSPVLSLIPGILITSYADHDWSLAALILGLLYLGIASQIARKNSLASLVVWLYFGGHLAIAIAASLALSAPGLSLVLAAQLVSIAWIMRTFEPVDLGWLMKFLTAILLVRLTLNPWLLQYPDLPHWTLWTYGGSTLLCITAAHLLKQVPNSNNIVPWLEGAALHLLTLTFWTELRYWIYHGKVFSSDFDALEASLYVVLFGLLAIVYFQRSLVSRDLAWLYRTFFTFAQLLTWLSYGVILVATLLSLDWVSLEIGSAPIFNLTLLFYGAPLLIGLLSIRYGMPALRTTHIWISGLVSLVFISLQIRHLWTGSIQLNTPISNGELYTYSVTWLLIAITAMLGGTMFWGNRCYQAGMALLVLVIAKIFLVDMSDLQGLLRVASFMGLGLALLGISYLHQRLKNSPVQA